ncbi:MAG: 2-succinyl-5-enolpyruvyl-6-hydroxy-3-cyclohexene-carboxylic-acid synthase [Bacteroidota bacterium]
MLLPLFHNQWQVFANRGVSGIDGCTSTALGMALNSKHTQILFTGDLAFAYDNNAWFQSVIPSQLKVVVFNNFGGGIFDQIEGPQNMPEKHLIQTPHKFGFELLAKHYQINYALVQSAEALTIQFEKFLNTDGPCVLEIQTNNSDNYHQLQQYKQSNL